MFVRQFADLVALARKEENQGAGGENERGFAQKGSHEVRHSNRRALWGARRKAPREENAERPTPNVQYRRQRPARSIARLGSSPDF
jgi:hypothetical protein